MMMIYSILNYNGKSRVKNCPVLNKVPRHEDLQGRGDAAPRVIKLYTRWRWVISFTPRPLYLRGKNPVTHW